MQAIMVITTVEDEELANLLSRELVGRRHAACVNIFPGIKSVYRWQGKICRDGEYFLLVKSTAEEFDAVAATIRELHNYDEPEILAFNVARGEASFLEWIESSLDKTAPFEEEVDEEFADID